MRQPRLPSREGRWSFSWVGGIVTALLVATVPPLIWFWFGIDKEGRPVKKPDGTVATENKGKESAQAGDLLQPGSVWTGTMDLSGSKGRNVKDMRLLVQKREGDAFWGETQWNREQAVLEIEGQLNQNAITWKIKKILQGPASNKSFMKGSCTGTINQDGIEATHTEFKDVSVRVKLRLEKAS